MRQRRRQRKIAALLAGQRRVPPVVFASDTARNRGAAETPRIQALKGVPVAPGTRGRASAAAGRPGERDVGGARQVRGDEIIVARSANLGLRP